IQDMWYFYGVKGTGSLAGEVKEGAEPPSLFFVLHAIETRDKTRKEMGPPPTSAISHDGPLMATYSQT
ncbi:hypothetical protein, partial [Candidatus Magnetobacterium casense]|uniref:hypothetical protein n=1 Tax=Candidatus Magnetobacterium casense TaxID=1455061 RepID=UPI001C485489